ncbi:MAG: glycolate oxidase iron-sulfur subunit [Halioglobus sp.]|jgi:glycolate oxidase iron-sulfur subunit
MQTNLHPLFKNSTQGKEADSILRSCVHCGFCTATCPTYQELGDERDGPRGRIYLIKQLLEEGEATDKTRLHLDRCLNCRSCETTCPSGVEYGRLVDIGKEIIEQQQSRPVRERLLRWGLRQIMPYPRRFTPLLRIGQLFRPLLPSVLKHHVPVRRTSGVWPSSNHGRGMLALAGCVQPGSTPNTNVSAATVLDRLGVTLIEEARAGCCGALSYHLSMHDEGLNFMRRNIDAWWPAIEAGAEAIVVTASGCGTTVKEYGHLLRDDPEYATKAARVSEMAKDLSEILLKEDLSRLTMKPDPVKTAIHCPCSLQHGQQLPDSVEMVLKKIGINLVDTAEKHLCCGSAGTYSILQPQLSRKLLDNKVRALMVESPERIVTANIGCQLHIESKSPVPVQHWIEIVAQRLDR